ncbi:MAG: D-alanine--D-alanine ligase [Firmicutes bacterium]|nr:D-alanine--D-alanine ligase [Bacillota bacterium]
MCKNEKIRLAVVFGGRSSEHEVSLKSAAAVISNADKEKYDIVQIGITKDGRWLIFEGEPSSIADGSWQRHAEEALAKDPERFAFSVAGSTGRTLAGMADFVFPIIHGQYGEDGSIQGLLEQLGLPYAGSGVTGSAVCMDKSMAKLICAGAGIPQTPYVFLEAHDISDEMIRGIDEKLRYPLFVKPAGMGSSVGITRVAEPAGLKAALFEAASYDSRIVVEQGVRGRELEVAVMGNETPRACEIGEIISAGTFYSYDAKYNDEGSRTVIAPALPEGKREELLRLAERCYETLGCEGYARVDFFMDEDGVLLLNEINTIPGFTSISMFPMLAQASGLTYSQVIDRIIELGFERAEKRRKLRI